MTDQINGIDPLALRDAYSFRWLHGSDADLQRLVGGAAIVEEQFAKAHGITVGKRFRVTGPTGHSATLTAIAEYRDPELMQGVMVDVAQFRALSSLRDPLSYFVTLVPGTDTATAQRQVKAALAEFPSAKVRTRAQYSDYIGAQLDQIVYLLYALLAMSIVISMFGIANSLFLSIHERTRELGMLRAIGATAAQVRRMIRYESVITSLIGGVLGTGGRGPLRLADDVRGQGPRRRLQHPGGPARGLPRARRRRRGPRRRRAGAPRGAPADPGRRAQRVRRSARDVEPRRLRSAVRRRTGSVASRVVPAPGADRTLSVPPTSSTRSRMPRSPKPSWWASGAKPGPSSRTTMVTASALSAIATWTSASPACLTAFVRPSWTRR